MVVDRRLAHLHGSARDLRRILKDRLRKEQWRYDVRLVATEDGTANIMPHFMSQGLIDAMRHVGQLTPDFYMKYARASATALGKLVQGLDSQELLQFIGAAWKASGGGSGAER